MKCSNGARFSSDDLVGGDDVSGGTRLNWLRRLHDILDDGLLRGGGRGSHLSLGWLDSDDLRAHVLLFEHLLGLDALVDAVELEALLDHVDDGGPESDGTDDHVPEAFGLDTSLILVHVWQFVEPFLVRVPLFLPVILVRSSVLLIGVMVRVFTH